MNIQNDYRNQVNIKRMQKLHEISRELPVYCTDFFRSVSQTTSSLTRLAYAYDYRLFFEYLTNENPDFNKAPRLFTKEDFERITLRDIEGYQDYLMLYYKENSEDETQRCYQNHENGIMRKLCSLRTLFDYLFKNEIVKGNVVSLLELPKLHEKAILRLERDEMQKLLDTAQTGDGLSETQQKRLEKTQKRDVAMLMLFLGTGIRVSECVGLNLEDIDFDQNAFLVTRKGGDQSILYFNEQVADALREYVDERLEIEPVEGHENALFLSLQRKRITQRAVENLVKKYAAVAAPLKKRISPHKLRSTFGTNLYQETGDIYLVADVLGHSDVNTTRRHYAAMSDKNKRKAAQCVPLPETDKTNRE